MSAPRRQAAGQLVKPGRLIALLDLDGAGDLDALAASGDLVPVRLGSTALVRYRVDDVAALLTVDLDTAAALLGLGTDCLGWAA